MIVFIIILFMLKKKMAIVPADAERCCQDTLSKVPVLLS